MQPYLKPVTLEVSGRSLQGMGRKESNRTRLPSAPGPSIIKGWGYPSPNQAISNALRSLHINWLWKAGILIPCQSALNTPLLLVKKPHSNDYIYLGNI